MSAGLREDFLGHFNAFLRLLRLLGLIVWRAVESTVTNLARRNLWVLCDSVFAPRAVLLLDLGLSIRGCVCILWLLPASLTL